MEREISPRWEGHRRRKDEGVDAEQDLGVVARVTAKPDCVEPVKAILMGVVEPSRREPGNISYQLLQNNSDPTDFTFVEEWTTAPAEQAHFSTPHIIDALQRLPGLLAAEPDIRRYSLLK